MDNKELDLEHTIAQVLYRHINFQTINLNNSISNWDRVNAELIQAYGIKIPLRKLKSIVSDVEKLVKELMQWWCPSWCVRWGLQFIPPLPPPTQYKKGVCILYNALLCWIYVIKKFLKVAVLGLDISVFVWYNIYRVRKELVHTESGVTFVHPCHGYCGQCLIRFKCYTVKSSKLRVTQEEYWYCKEQEHGEFIEP